MTHEELSSLSFILTLPFVNTKTLKNVKKTQTPRNLPVPHLLPRDPLQLVLAPKPKRPGRRPRPDSDDPPRLSRLKERSWRFRSPRSRITVSRRSKSSLVQFARGVTGGDSGLKSASTISKSVAVASPSSDTMDSSEIGCTSSSASASDRPRR